MMLTARTRRDPDVNTVWTEEHLLKDTDDLRAFLDDIASMAADGLDPIEPPPQGDVNLDYVRKHYGRDLVLFGNLEIADMENLPTEQFAEKVKRALDEGTAGTGRGFVLMPSACPYGRVLSDLTMNNYEKMIEITERG